MAKCIIPVAVLAQCLLATALPATVGPVIGVLTAPWCVSSDPKKSGFQEHCEDSPVSGFSNLEVKYLEQAGAKVVPIRYDLSPDEVTDMFSSVNGILYTGGMLSLLPNTTYYRTAKHLYDLSMKAFDAADIVPIMGICMGFQLLNIMTADDYSVLDHSAFDSENIVWPLEITADGYSSKLLQSASPRLVKAVATQNITINWHKDGVTREKFFARPQLPDFYRVISYNHDARGKEFVSTIEGWERPVWGIQWHPEAVQFDWGPNSGFINRSPEAIEVMQHVANVFVAEARKNEHQFPTFEEEARAVIYNFKPQPSNNSYQLYLFGNDSAILSLPISDSVNMHR